MDENHLYDPDGADLGVVYDARRQDLGTLLGETEPGVFWTDDRLKERIGQENVPNDA